MNNSWLWLFFISYFKKCLAWRQIMSLTTLFGSVAQLYIVNHWAEKVNFATLWCKLTWCGFALGRLHQIVAHLADEVNIVIFWCESTQHGLMLGIDLRQTVAVVDVWFIDRTIYFYFLFQYLWSSQIILYVQNLTFVRCF